MNIIFMCPSSTRPIGGVLAIYNFANGLARRGHGVHVVHLPMWDQAVTCPEDLPDHVIDPSIEQYFPAGEDGRYLPDADVSFGLGSLPRLGLPVSLVQGVVRLDPKLDLAVFRAPCLKVCVASWLVDIGRRLGVPDDQLGLVPLGLDHDTYRSLVPWDDRPVQVGVLYGAHPLKRWKLALGSLEEARRSVPEMTALAFGSEVPDGPLPEWLTFITSPNPEELVHSIYNRCRVFLQVSRYEGFGLTALEAMACGAAVVTTDTGGSRDYAFQDRTAVIARPEDLGREVASLLGDPTRARRLAEAGRAHAQRFSWEASARDLETLLEAYVADPDRYRAEPSPIPPGDQLEMQTILRETAPPELAQVWS